MNDLVVRDGAAPVRLSVDPTRRDDWSYTGIHVIDLGAGGSHTLTLDGQETLVVPLAADVEVHTGGQTHHLARTSVYAGVADTLYVPVGEQITLTGTGRVALATAVATTSYPLCFLPAADVPVNPRGGGNMTRMVRGYAMPGSFEACERLLVCEVITPGGNWSSYPPHKHDETSENERELEEIYYFEIKADEHGPGMAFHSTYGTPERPIDVALRVGTGDTALVPHGWHGPCVAAPGYDLYYLNVMAGPGGSEWLSVDDPCYGWLRQTWDDTDVDPRLPYAPNRLDA